MKAEDINILEFMSSKRQLVIPIYQRKYSWSSEQCTQLWDDILRAGQARAGRHFVGSIMYVVDNDAHNAPLRVIDGQQRLTTLSLLLVAISRALEDGEEPFDGFSKRKLENYYLKNGIETGDKARKLILSEADRFTMYAIVDNNELPTNYSQRIAVNFDFFKEQIEKNMADLRVICQGIARLHVVTVGLSSEYDNPQLIFESMNSTGQALSQADLIRNFVLLGEKTNVQEDLYNGHWRQMEKDFGQQAMNDGMFDSFMRHFLTLETVKIPKLRDVYREFKNYARSGSVTEQGIKELVKKIRRYARFYCKIAFGKESEPRLAIVFQDFCALKVDVAYPFLLALYADYHDKILSRDHFIEIVRLIESYVFRRAVCDLPSNIQKDFFANFHKSLDKNCYLESVKEHFCKMSSNQRFPDDDEFLKNIKKRNLYKFQKRNYWLWRFENHGSKERIKSNECSIEHIMPQNDNLSKEWKDALGSDWQRIHEQYLHTLGNLTLTGYNSEYSDKPFTQKRNMEGGFRHSRLNLNRGLGDVEEWNEDAIKTRAERLAAQACKVWGYPDLPEDIIEKIRQANAARPRYTIKDHPHLENAPVKEFYGSFHNAVFNLDSEVEREILKQHIAYKVDTNFADVVPQKKGLKLYLNMEFVDIDDPHGLCRDVTGTSHWGNGNVEVKFTDINQLSQIISLVRQSLEQQLADAGEI